MTGDPVMRPPGPSLCLAASVGRSLLLEAFRVAPGAMEKMETETEMTNFKQIPLRD